MRTEIASEEGEKFSPQVRQRPLPNPELVKMPKDVKTPIVSEPFDDSERLTRAALPHARWSDRASWDRGQPTVRTDKHMQVKPEDDNERIVALDQWLWERAFFHDEKVAIFPWGFKDRDLEAKFQEAYRLTSANNHRRVLAWMFGLLVVKNFHALYSFAVASPSASWNTWLCSGLVYRTVVLIMLTHGFSQKLLSWYCKLVYRVIFLSHAWWLVALMVLSECSEHSKRGSTSVASAVIAIFSAVNSLRAGSWTLASATTLVMCIVSAACYFLELQRADNPRKFNLSADLLGTNLLGAAFGVALNAHLQVSRRRKWHRARSASGSWHAQPSRRRRRSRSSRDGRVSAKGGRSRGSSLHEVSESEDEGRPHSLPASPRSPSAELVSRARDRGSSGRHGSWRPEAHATDAALALQQLSRVCSGDGSIRADGTDADAHRRKGCGAARESGEGWAGEAQRGAGVDRVDARELVESWLRAQAHISHVQP